jgi:WD40 repeat protein
MRIPWDWRNQDGISFFPRQEIWTRRKGSNFAFFISFSLYSGLNEGIVIWTPLAKKKTRILRQHSRFVAPLSFSPDGRFLASAGYGELIIWSTEVNKKTEPIKMVWYLVVIQYWIYSTLFQNWEPVYIEEGVRSVSRLSWLSSSTDVPDYKLAFDSWHGNKVSTDNNIRFLKGTL